MLQMVSVLCYFPYLSELWLTGGSMKNPYVSLLLRLTGKSNEERMMTTTIINDIISEGA